VELEQDQVIHASGFSPSWLHIPRITAAEICTVRADLVCLCCLASLRPAATITYCMPRTPQLALHCA